jgi:hypothetical protein
MCYDVEPLAYGYQDAVLLVSANSHSRTFGSKVFSLPKEFPHITYATELIGAWDFELGADLRQSEDIVPLIQELNHRLQPHLSSIRPLQRFRSIVFRPFPFERTKIS